MGGRGRGPATGQGATYNSSQPKDHSHSFLGLPPPPLNPSVLEMGARYLPRPGEQAHLTETVSV